VQKFTNEKNGDPQRGFCARRGVKFTRAGRKLPALWFTARTASAAAGQRKPLLR
jgi:hypothetical protein